MIFQLCTSTRVTIWQINVLRTPTVSVDIGTIKDEANDVAPRRGPRVEVQQLRENLEDTVKHTQGVDHATSEPTDIAQSSLSQTLVGHQVPPCRCIIFQHWSRLLGSKI